MKNPLLCAFLFGLALSIDAFCQAVVPAQPTASQPAGGAAAGVLAATLPEEQHMGGTPEQTKVVALAVGIAGFAAAAASNSTSANH